MKTRDVKGMIVLLMVIMLSSTVFGQVNRDQYMGIAGLTDDQKTQIEKLRTAHQKDMLALKNQIAENRAHYRTLMTADKPDMNAINKNIDEYASLRASMMKKQAAHRQDIRKLLTDEQRLAFDSRKAGKGRGMGMGMGQCPNCPHKGYGRGPGRGFNHPMSPMGNASDK